MYALETASLVPDQQTSEYNKVSHTIFLVFWVYKSSFYTILQTSKKKSTQLHDVFKKNKNYVPLKNTLSKKKIANNHLGLQSTVISLLMEGLDSVLMAADIRVVGAENWYSCGNFLK